MATPRDRTATRTPADARREAAEPPGPRASSATAGTAQPAPRVTEIPLYRGADPDIAGSGSGPHGRLVVSTEARLFRELSNARTPLVTSGPVFNATPESVRRLAGAYARLPTASRQRFVLARWVPRPGEHRTVVDLLRGVDQLEIVVPSAHRGLRRHYVERFHPRQVAAVLRELEAAGIEPVLVVQIGIPGDGPVLETLRATYALSPRRVVVRRFAVAPGSHFDVHRRRHHLEIDAEAPHVVRAHRTANAFVLAWALELARRSAHAYNYWRRQRDAVGGAGGAPAASQ